MKIPEKFKVNTKDFKIYFDNDKKTHVCENLNTGEKTNIGVLGILMQMGILKPIEDKTTEEKLLLLSEGISNLEAKIDNLIKNVDGLASKPAVKETPKEEEVREEKPKSEMNERIMKKVLEQTKEEKEEPVEKDEAEEESPEDVEIESDEEIDNWMKI